MVVEKANNIAMIPARIGSTRLLMKNLALIDGKPMIAYAVQAAQEAKVFDRIVINSDSHIFSKVAERYNVDFYLRPKTLGASSTKSDEVVYDFIKKNPCEVITWVNPIAPLQSGEEIQEIIKHFIEENLDTLITVKREQVHADYEDSPINYQRESMFDKTQDLTPVDLFVYSIMMWKSDLFTDVYNRNGYSFFNGKLGLYPVSNLSSIIVKREEDIMLIEYIVKSLKSKNKYRVSYDPLVEDMINE